MHPPARFVPAEAVKPLKVPGFLQQQQQQQQELGQQQQFEGELAYQATEDQQQQQYKSLWPAAQQQEEMQDQQRSSSNYAGLQQQQQQEQTSIEGLLQLGTMTVAGMSWWDEEHTSTEQQREPEQQQQRKWQVIQERDKACRQQQEQWVAATAAAAAAGGEQRVGESSESSGWSEEAYSVTKAKDQVILQQQQEEQQEGQEDHYLARLLQQQALIGVFGKEHVFEQQHQQQQQGCGRQEGRVLEEQIWRKQGEEEQQEVEEDMEEKRLGEQIFWKQPWQLQGEEQEVEEEVQEKQECQKQQEEQQRFGEQVQRQQQGRQTYKKLEEQEGQEVEEVVQEKRKEKVGDVGTEVEELVLKHQVQQEELLLQQLLRERKGRQLLQPVAPAAVAAPEVDAVGESVHAFTARFPQIRSGGKGVAGWGADQICRWQQGQGKGQEEGQVREEGQGQGQVWEQGQGEEGEKQQQQGSLQGHQQKQQQLCMASGSPSRMDQFMAGWVSAEPHQEQLITMPASLSRAFNSEEVAAACGAACGAGTAPSPSRADPSRIRHHYGLMSPSSTPTKNAKPACSASRGFTHLSPVTNAPGDSNKSPAKTHAAHRIMKTRAPAAVTPVPDGSDGPVTASSHHLAQQVMTHQLQGQLQLKDKIIGDLRQHARQLTEAAADRDGDLTAMQRRLGVVKRQVEGQGQLLGRVQELKGRVAGLEREVMMLVREREGLQGQLMKLKAQVSNERVLGHNDILG